jgi:hypothetical protein
MGWAGDPSFRAPMGVAVIGGLAVSTVMSLVIVPAMFTVVDDFQQWVSRIAGHTSQSETGRFPAHYCRRLTHIRTSVARAASRESACTVNCGSHLQLRLRRPRRDGNLSADEGGDPETMHTGRTLRCRVRADRRLIGPIQERAALAQETACAQIARAAERLACYDRALPPAKAAPGAIERQPQPSRPVSASPTVPPPNGAVEWSRTSRPSSSSACVGALDAAQASRRITASWGSKSAPRAYTCLRCRSTRSSGLPRWRPIFYVLAITAGASMCARTIAPWR